MSVFVEKGRDMISQNVVLLPHITPRHNQKNYKVNFIVARDLDHTIAEAVCPFMSFRVSERCG
jgi:hypothetical protein